MVENDFVLLKLPGDEKSPGLSIDLAPIAAIEARIPEIAFVTPAKAHELLAAFNEGQRELTTLIVKVGLSLHAAEQNADAIKATIMLDKVEGILAAKGITKSSVDLREAVLALDPEYQQARDRVAYVEAVLELLKGKQEGIKRAYFSVQNVFHESGFYARPVGGGQIEEGAKVGDAPKPKYSLPAGYQPPKRNKPYGT